MRVRPTTYHVLCQHITPDGNTTAAIKDGTRIAVEGWPTELRSKWQHCLRMIRGVPYRISITQSLTKVDPRALICTSFEKALIIQQPRAKENIARLRRVHPDKTPQDLISYINKWYLGAVTASGAGAGTTAVIPNGVVQTSAAMIDLVTYLEASVFYILSLAEIHDLDLEDLERRKMLVTAVLIGNSASYNNLKDVSVSFPVGALTVISGVAGSGKSSLASVLAKQHPEVAVIDQMPLAASSRSSLLTVLGLDTPIRGAFSRISGLSASWFSANGKGACSLCKGRGTTRIDMAFMDDVQTRCERCGGRRFNETTMAVLLPYGSRGLTIADVLDSGLDRVGELYADQDEVLIVIFLLQRAGLGYLTLGRTLDTLSGGELQRIKLVRFFKEHQWDQKNVLVLDEITTGLHPKDVEQMMRFLRHLTTKGVTVIAIDHNLEAIAQADDNIDIGPGAGAQGGTVVFAGTPRGLADCPSSLTGSWLQKALFSSHIRLTK
ncbi:hypothetical protein [Trueperella pecoris]|uniref:hypothetical protein n=1 Tax=Trueperella pecoris TaxID=2733571 RepID=UPI0018D3E6AF|nr:hypothetical protein [Trueperella pecoris]